MRRARAIVPAILAALALCSCVATRQDRSYQPLSPTTLSSRELRDAKTAVAPIAETHVFDWNTVSAQRQRKLLHVTVEALPEPQADGSVFQPLADCIRGPVDWDCEVRIERSLYTQVDVRGARQRVVVRIANGIEVANAESLVRRAYEALPGIGSANECRVRERAGSAALAQLQAAFAVRTAERALSVGRDYSGIYVRSESFNLSFESVDGGPARYDFVCWAYTPVLETQ